MSMTKCDVLIIGASMAGSCLARHIKLKHPQLSVVMLEKKREFDYGIGESMLEIFWDYAAKDLKLGHYLDSHYYPKNGLRFFFDNEGKDLSLEDMSEIGRTWSDSIPAHQIDRKRFDQDLLDMNLASGVQVRLGCTAKDIELNADQGHVVTTADGEQIQCRWLVDASGMQAPLARKLNLIEPIETHPISSRWVRVKNINLLDYLGSDAWRERVYYNSRFLSTVHFMYAGYWFWMIPLDHETVSIGLVWHHDKAHIDIKTQADFEAFMKSHRALSEVLGDQYEILDYHGLKNMSRMADQFFSEERWFLTGMSAAFLDPLFSSGSAFLSDANRMILDLIETDMAGDRDAMKNKCIAYNEHARWWLQNFLLHITGNYHGSYDLLRQLFEPLLMDYFGLILPVSMAKLWGYEPGKTYDQKALRAMKEGMLQNGAAMQVHQIAEQLATFLKHREGLFTKNVGQFFDIKITKDYIKNSLTRGVMINPDTIMKLHTEMLELAASLALRRMAYSTGDVLCETRFLESVREVVKDRMPLEQAYQRCVMVGHDELQNEPMAA